MKKICLFCIVVIAFLVMPFGVLAKDYVLDEFYDSDLVVVYGDTIDTTSYDFTDVELSRIRYMGNNYYIGRYIGQQTGVFKYDYEFLSSFGDLENSGDCIEKEVSNSDGVSSERLNVCPGTTEYSEFIDYISDSSNKPHAHLIFNPYSMIGGSLTINLEYPEIVEKKISLDVSYFNLMNSSAHSVDANPVSYVTEDGTIVLQDLERTGYDFEGWYLDKKYQYRVTALTQELVEEYFSDDGQYSEIEKKPLEEVDGELVGNIDLYAKWSVNNGKGLSNPQTSSTICIVVLILSLVGAVLYFYVFSRKKRNNIEV